MSPVFAKSRRVGLLGGSFDPPHKGHLALAEAALATGKLDCVCFVPAAVSPFKQGSLQTTDEQRLAMLECICAENPRFCISQEDLSRGGVSYTCELLEELKKKFPEKEFFFLIGADSLESLSRWHRAGDLVKLCRFLSFGRPGTKIDSAQLGFDSETNARLYADFSPALSHDISSTQVREKLAAGKDASAFLPAAVSAYIRREGLYR